MENIQKISEEKAKHTHKLSVSEIPPNDGIRESIQVDIEHSGSLLDNKHSDISMKHYESDAFRETLKDTQMVLPNNQKWMVTKKGERKPKILMKSGLILT